jgi:hypothetical protein
MALFDLGQRRRTELELGLQNIGEVLTERHKELFSMQKADAFGFPFPGASVCVCQDQLKANNFSSLIPLKHAQHGSVARLALPTVTRRS